MLSASEVVAVHLALQGSKPNDDRTTKVVLTMLAQVVDPRLRNQTAWVESLLGAVSFLVVSFLSIIAVF